ncbi:zinc-binding dehydrogenase [Kribbella sp. NPDC056345]|uniref:zinc-binding dehydrogenase n=1 Tax=Kribbella sp. NPDC056345 TaxID=3345789 RepID=UPI0035E373C5
MAPRVSPECSATTGRSRTSTRWTTFRTSNDLPAEAFQRYVDLVAAGKLPIRIDRVFTMDEIGEAHRIMADGGAVGKLVVTV